MENLAFQINKQDNVATVLSECKNCDVRLTGENEYKNTIAVMGEIPSGHKVAIKNINAGEQVIKYGISIGVATKNIKKGEWVHLHCMKSNYDERSNHLDVKTGVPTDSIYE